MFWERTATCAYTGDVWSLHERESRAVRHTKTGYPVTQKGEHEQGGSQPSWFVVELEEMLLANYPPAQEPVHPERVEHPLGSSSDGRRNTHAGRRVYPAIGSRQTGCSRCPHGGEKQAQPPASPAIAGQAHRKLFSSSSTSATTLSTESAAFTVYHTFTARVKVFERFSRRNISRRRTHIAWYTH